MDWIFTSLFWYVELFLLGIIFFPVVKYFFADFTDQGYAFSKTIAIVVLSYTAFFLATVRALPFSQFSLFALIFLYGGLSILFSKYKKRRNQKLNFKLIIFEEILFLFSFLFLTYIRGQEPSIHGLEKFMDFGFMNSILRSQYFPPLDIWYSGSPINYYYFGHITGALLIKLTGIKPAIGYNLILATILAQGMIMTFSLTSNIINAFKKIDFKNTLFFGLIGAFIVNLGGNLHTIYLFTKGYPNESPVPFWQIMSWVYAPAKYWYPNATRFIPFTIHEFPSYSYVVADLHGHVFDIPFVLLTLTILLMIFLKKSKFQPPNSRRNPKFEFKNLFRVWNLEFRVSAIIGFMTAVHYMTNAFDGPIYMLVSFTIYALIFGLGSRFLLISFLTISFFFLFSLPFSLNFAPFVSGIGVNCSPKFLTSLVKLGPFLFEKDKCQISPIWMMFVLWGAFWVNLGLFALVTKKLEDNKHLLKFILALFTIGTIFIIIPEFFYIKDIYPAHFRANTLFKLGYQSFIMMGIASTVAMYFILTSKIRLAWLYKMISLAVLTLIFLYPFQAFPSYYGGLNKKVELDGSSWMKSGLAADHEIIDYLNKNVQDQPVILEAQGDSYTDYERVSAYTGLPTVAGWWVHEWLWRGSADVVGKRIPDVAAIYESQDVRETTRLIDKYQVKYIVVSNLEREKYKNLNKDKLERIGQKIFESSDGFGALYQVN